MTESPAAGRRSSSTGLWVVAGLAVVLLVAGAVTVGLLMWRAGERDEQIPAGWSTREYRVTTARGTPSEQVREDVALVLIQRVRAAGVGSVRSAVRPRGVVIAVPGARAAVLDTLGVVRPVMTIQEVTAARPRTGDCPTGAVCDRDTAYQLGTMVVRGAAVRSADARVAAGGGWMVTVRFDAAGTDAFAAATRRLAGTGRQLAIVVDGAVVSAPTVNDVITGAVDINGTMDRADAEALAAGLRLERNGAAARPGNAD